MLIRIFDITVSLVVLVIAFPILIFTALAIKLDSRGPVFFWQQRVGLKYKKFWILKFRTMKHNTKSLSFITSGENFNSITRIGSIIRKLHLDELVQLYNVLKGEMSLVGPRPEVPKYTEFYKDKWDEVLTVRPGITGLATVKLSRKEYRILANSKNPEKDYIERILPEKLKVDLDYIKHRNLANNISIILKTFLRIFFK